MDLYGERLHVCYDKYHHGKTKDVSSGCSLSPLMRGVYLTPLDAYAKENKLDSVRYMDDVLFLRIHDIIKVIDSGRVPDSQSTQINAR